MNLNSLLFSLVGIFHSIEHTAKKKLTSTLDTPTLIILESFFIMIIGCLIGFTQITPIKFLENIKKTERNSYLILLGGVLFFILYLFVRYYLMRKTKLGIYVLYEEVSIILSSLLLGYLFFNETLKKVQAMGVFLVLLGIYFINI